MAFQVMGVTAGRKNSNSEILLKEALLVCQEMGAEVRMINLKDYNIIDCNGCTSCTMGMSMGKYTGCSLDDADDKKKIMDVMLNQDAVIFSAPTYDLMPSSLFLKFMHRNLAYESAFLTKIGAIEPRDRVGALIAVGGSTRSWQSMALECMQATTFTNSFKIVDMYMATQVPAPGQVLLYDEKIARAREIGKNVMEALNTKPEERKWLGDPITDGVRTATAIHCVWASRSGKVCNIRSSVPYVAQAEIWSEPRMVNGNLSSRLTDWSVTVPQRKAVVSIVMKSPRHREDFSWIRRNGKKLRQNYQNIKN